MAGEGIDRIFAATQERRAVPIPSATHDSAVPIAIVTQAVRLSSRHARLVILAYALLTIAAADYLVRHFAITTDSEKLISTSLPWRQQEIRLDQAFPQRADQIIAVVDATTPEAADEGAAALTAALSARPDVVRTVGRPDGGEFFERNGVLYLSVEEVRRAAADLIRAQPFLGTLAADPTLRGVMGVLSQAMEGVRRGKSKLDDLQPALTAIADALDRLARGEDPAFSWRRLFAGDAPRRAELRRFVVLQPVLDFDALEPGGKATAAIREAAAQLALTPAHGVTVRLTGPVALSDEEFGTIADGAALNGAVTGAVVLILLWAALRRFRIVLAVLVNLVVGLAVTGALGLMMVGAFNLISVAFAVLFVGLGVDFGIQFSVRYREERRRLRDFDAALAATALKIASPLLLAAASIAAAFYAFLPTAYRGLSELGLIAGTGMIVAFLTTATLLPALLSALRPGPETAPIGWKALAPLDRFLERRRHWVVGATLAATILGSPLLLGLRFDFNPLDLRARSAESVSTLIDLMRDPDTSPNTIDILENDLSGASKTAESLRALPEVARAMTLESLVPDGQEEKLAILDDARFFLANTLDPERIDAAPTPGETAAAVARTARDLASAAGGRDIAAAKPARRLAGLLDALAKGPQEKRADAERAFVAPLLTTLRQTRALLSAETVSIETLPPALKAEWLSAKGEARIEVAPSGDGDDNATLRRFVDAVRRVAPDATGTPVFITEAAATVVEAFLQAGLLSLASIALILFIGLGRLTDVALTLTPLLIAIVATLEICVAIGLPFNFANIIALPLLLGVGVAFKIYYVMAWRGGETDFLQSSLTRAVVFSACATATAFGSLWFSHHPGTSSMGELMALSLVTTLSAAVLFQPALLATQREGTPSRPKDEHGPSNL